MLIGDNTMVKNLSFSERYGYKKVCNIIQVESMSDELRISILNTFIKIILKFGKGTRYSGSNTIEDSIDSSAYNDFWESFFNSFYESILKKPLTEVPYKTYAWNEFERYLKFGTWDEIYSLIEWFIDFLDTEYAESITQYFNNTLENGCAGYRIIDKLVVPVTDEREIIEIETALKQNKKVKEHLNTALRYLSEKGQKDFRNSVKESISAVEVVARQITGKNTLGEALSELNNKGIYIPNVLKQGFDKIYAWTNGNDGIRHALMEDANTVGMAEAYFMLIACSAFINYMKMKQVN